MYILLRLRWMFQHHFMININGYYNTFHFRSSTLCVLWTKNIVKADYLIDDNPRQLAIFEGEPIIYTAAHM